MISKKEGYFSEECFPVSAFALSKYKSVKKFYLTAKIYSKYSLLWMTDENGIYIEHSEFESSDGLLSYLIEPNGKKRNICLKFSYNRKVTLDYVAYSISILEPTKLETFIIFILHKQLANFIEE